MGVNVRSKILTWLLAAAAAVLLVLELAGLFRDGPSPDDASGQTPRAGVPMRSAPAPEPRAATAPPVLAASNDAGLPSEPAAEAAPAGAPTRHPVDLEKLRELLPNNLY